VYAIKWSGRKGGTKAFDSLQDAIFAAREKARSWPMPVAIYNEAQVVVGVVTDDANGLTVHRFVPWGRVNDKQDQFAWRLFGAHEGSRGN
jgi:hypothetical protein